MFRITADPSSGSLVRYLAKNYQIYSIVPVGMEEVGVMAAYSAPLCVCVVHCIYTVNYTHCIYTVNNTHCIYTVNNTHCIYTVNYTHYLYSEQHTLYLYSEQHTLYLYSELHTRTTSQNTLP